MNSGTKQCLRLLRYHGRTFRSNTHHHVNTFGTRSLRSFRSFSSSTPRTLSTAPAFVDDEYECDDYDYDYDYDYTEHPALIGSLTPTVPVTKIRNFSPGPTSLPEAVEAEILSVCFPASSNGSTFTNTNGHGQAHHHRKRLASIALSHRSPEFTSILEEALDKTRDVLEIPNSYEVLFLQGGGHGQFAAVPLNLCPTGTETAAYILNGTWSERAAAEARKYCCPVTFHGPTDDVTGKYTGYPDWDELADRIDPSSKYIYLCSNETVNGIELHKLPNIGKNGTNIPLVVDASSDVTSKPIDWEGANVGVLFACASKNIGHPGVTLVVVRKDFLGGGNANLDLCPGVFNYKTNAEAANVWNTTPTFNVDVMRIVMDWIKREGGIHEMEARSIRKSQRVYETIDDRNFYSTPLPPSGSSSGSGGGASVRSRMNIPFDVAGGDEELTDRFLIESFDRGLVGFRTKTPFGNSRYLRASLYHGVSEEDVDHLVDFMNEFAAKYSGSR